jgi:hypothetical protein
MSLTLPEHLTAPGQTFINANLGDMQDLYVIDATLLTFRRLSPTLEGTWLEEELGPEFSLRPGAVRRLRNPGRAHPSNLQQLHAIGTSMAAKQYILNVADFPAAFDIPGMRAADQSG